MSQVRTDLRDTRERARELRFEPTATITQTDVQKAIEQASTQPQAITPTPISAANSPFVPQPTDTLIYVDTSAGAVIINLAAAAARNGLPLVIKDVSGQAAANNVTINPNGVETIDGLTPWTLQNAFDGVRLNPRAGIGYTVAP